MISATSVGQKRPRVIVLPSVSTDSPRSARHSFDSAAYVGSLPGTSRPADVLALLKSGQRPDVVVYSDQLVSAVDAPIPVERADGLVFLPAIELLLVSQFGYRALVWSPEGLDEADSLDDLFVLLSRYLDNCASQDDWLVRSLQLQRTAASRIGAAELEVRRIQDAALCAWATSGHSFDLSLRNILVRSTDALKRLKAL